MDLQNERSFWKTLLRSTSEEVKRKIIWHLFNSKQCLYQTMSISNNEYIKQWLYRTMIISNNNYINQWLYQSMIISITTLKKVHWTLSYCRQVWKERRGYVERSVKVFCKFFSKKMYLKYRCKDIIGKHLLKLCAPSKLSISMEHTHRRSLLIRQFTKLSANCLFVIA